MSTDNKPQNENQHQETEVQQVQDAQQAEATNDSASSKKPKLKMSLLNIHPDARATMGERALAWFMVVAVAASAAMIISALFNVKARDIQPRAIVNLEARDIQPRAIAETQVTAPGGFTFETEEDFHKAVANSLERMVKERRDQDLAAKASKYEMVAEKVSNGKKIYGNLDARFTLVMFSETECPFCVRHHPVMKELVNQSKGNVNMQFKHLPLDFHNPAAYQQAVVGECVAEQKGNRGFWMYIDDVFAQSAGNGKGVADLSNLVENLDVDMNEIRKCLGSGEMNKIVDADIAMAKQLSINGTPATVVVDNVTGNTQIISGAQPASVFTSTIAAMMESSSKSE